MRMSIRTGKPVLFTLALLMFLLPSRVARADETVTFLDANLEAAIREVIGKPSGGICQSDIESLLSLDASSRGIVDITGLEYCR